MNDGVLIMTVGMMVVFAFLTIMVISMKFMSGYILKAFPEKERSVPRMPDPGQNDLEVAVAVAAAYIHR